MRKTYTKEFKLDICRSISNREMRISDIAQQYCIFRPIVSRWVAEYKRYGEKAFMGKGSRLPDEARIYVLEKEIERFKEENTILKKFNEFTKYASSEICLSGYSEPQQSKERANYAPSETMSIKFERFELIFAYSHV